MTRGNASVGMRLGSNKPVVANPRTSDSTNEERMEEIIKENRNAIKSYDTSDSEEECDRRDVVLKETRVEEDSEIVKKPVPVISPASNVNQILLQTQIERMRVEIGADKITRSNEITSIERCDNTPKISYVRQAPPRPREVNQCDGITSLLSCRLM